MKHAKRIFALALALVMVMALGVAAFAADGPATITIENSAAGETYKVYKLFDATVAEDGSVAYFTDKDVPDGLASFFTRSATGYITEAPETMTDVLKAALKAWAATATPVGSKPGDGGKLEFTGLDYGYYVVTTSLGEQAISVTSATPNATIYDKNDREPTVPDEGLKTITAVNGNTTADKTTAGVGDTVSFQIKVNTVNYKMDDEAATPITKYTITDTPQGMVIDQNSVVVKVGNEALTGVVSFDEAGNMTVVIPWTNEDGSMKYASPNTITVTYDAEITATEDVQNSAAASYNDDGSITPPDGPNPPVEVKNYTIAIDKYELGSAEKKLANAEFELYDAKTGGNKIPLVEESEGVYRVATQDERSAEGFVSAIVKTDENGAATIKGLKGDATYYLEEVTAPAGYNKMVERQELTIANADLTGDDAVEVPNQTGATLPSTGGIGTTIFYVVGGVLVAAAVVLLITKKRMSAKG